MKEIVIIGGGLGGLTSGAMLAKDGYKVTLLEQHTLAGGCATTFKRKGGFKCEVGLHEMDGVYSSKAVKKVFEYLKVYDHITFVKPEEFYRHKSHTLDFIMPNKKEIAIEKLKASYPHEAEGIDKYFALIKKLHNQIERIQEASWWEFALFPFIFFPLLRYRKTSLKKIMENLFQDEELKLLLNTNVQYYHNNIAELNILFHAVAQHSFFEGGGYFIKGGSQRLSDYFVSIIEEYGGRVILGANVTAIGKETNRATTVSYLDKKGLKHILNADIVISNLSPAQTYKMSDVVYEEKMDISTSLLTVYVGFNKNLKSIYGNRAYTTFLFKDINTIDDYDNDNSSLEHRAFVFTDYSQLDSGLTPEGKSFGVFCSVDSLEEWRELDKKSYKQKKDVIAKAYVETLSKEYPDIEKYIEFIEVGTAKTMKRYLKTPNGTAYGFAPTIKQFFRIPKTKSNKLKNLYFVGAWVIGGGFSAAIISANMCYSMITKNKK